jgi:hypothetical protein
MKGTVYILTTQGPAKVQRLAPEDDPEIRSVICLDGTTEALMVSKEYDALVRKPTGLIANRFGHPSWRMDVDQPIDAGRSFHLGAWIAHKLHSDHDSKNEDSIYFCSGELDREGNLRPIEHIGEKLRSMHELLSRTKSATLLLPPGNRSEAQKELIAMGIKHIILQTPDNISELDSVIEVKRPIAWKTAGTIGIMLLVLVIGWMKIKNSSTTVQTLLSNISINANQTQPTLELVELVPPPGSNCAAVIWEKVLPEEHVINLNKDGNFPDTKRNKVCAIRYQLRFLGAQPAEGKLVMRIGVEGTSETKEVKVSGILNNETDLKVKLPPMPRWIKRSRLVSLIGTVEPYKLSSHHKILP